MAHRLDTFGTGIEAFGLRVWGKKIVRGQVVRTGLTVIASLAYLARLRSRAVWEVSRPPRGERQEVKTRTRCDT